MFFTWSIKFLYKPLSSGSIAVVKKFSTNCLAFNIGSSLSLYFSVSCENLTVLPSLLLTSISYVILLFNNSIFTFVLKSEPVAIFCDKSGIIVDVCNAINNSSGLPYIAVQDSKSNEYELPLLICTFALFLPNTALLKSERIGIFIVNTFVFIYNFLFSVFTTA